MNENEARQTLLIRTLESAPRTAQWTDDDRDWASREAARIAGEQADADVFIALRAETAVARLTDRTPEIGRVLQALKWRAWVIPAFMLAAFLCGLLLDAVAADRRINILAPPLLALLVWNLLVLALSAISAARRRFTSPAETDRTPPNATQGPISRLFVKIAQAAGGRAPKHLGATLAEFVTQWTTLSAPLTITRSQAALHLSAAAFAAGALAGLYFRGLAFEYLAGWDSTFLDAAGVERLLHIVLGPASLLSGIALPDAQHLATLRLSTGAGENAGRWIHLHAVTIAVFVIAPRLALGALALVRARRMATHFMMPLTATYYRGLDRRQRGTRISVDAIPYSLSLREAGTQGLNQHLCSIFGGDTRVVLAPTVALGQEDTLSTHWSPTPGVSLVVALYALSATPEAETHGQFLRQLGAIVDGRAPIAVLVDESAMRQRFGDDTTRFETRRKAWRRLCADIIGSAPAFIWLERMPDEQASASLRKSIDEILARMGQNAGLQPRSADLGAHPATTG